MNDHEWMIIMLGEVQTLSSKTILAGLHNSESLTAQEISLGHLSSLKSNQTFEKRTQKFPSLHPWTLMAAHKFAFLGYLLGGPGHPRSVRKVVV